MPQAQAAKERGYNGGRDQFKREVPTRPASTCPTACSGACSGCKDNSWVTVEYLWTGAAKDGVGLGRIAWPPWPRLAQWIEGARPRTLPTAVSPVLVGTGAAIGDGIIAPGRALLALIVAVALVVGVNFANDYSDGIRGTDDDRVGPVRLVGSRAAAPATVRSGGVRGVRGGRRWPG